MAGKVSRQQATQKPAFDPRKNYKWQPDDIFELSGLDFSTIYNTLKEAVLSPAGTSAINLVASYNLATQLLARGVEEGVIVEVPAQTAPSEDTEETPEKPKASVRKKKAQPQEVEE